MYKQIKKILIVVLLLGTLGAPQISNAQWATVEGPGALLTFAAATAANTAITAEGQQSLVFKEFALDNIAYMLAKQAVRQLTTSIVNWINSGFDGNPAFLADPAGFFKDIGDQFLGEMIMSDKHLNFLCTPFSIDLRLALAFKYQPFQRRIQCTLSDVITNSTNALEGASINGFTAGNFAQGGWPAFVEMTTQPQNNLYGAYIQADNDLVARIGRYELLKRDELNQGRGLLSWRKCSDMPAPGDTDFTGPTQQGEGQSNLPADQAGPAVANSYSRTQNCEVQTPGSAIAGVLDANNTGPLQELHLADEINEIVNALFAQMVSKVLTVGLRGLSGNNGASDPQSYINQLQNEQVLSNQQLTNLRDTILRGIDGFINIELEIKNQYDTTAGLYNNIRSSLDNSKACFVGKLADPALSSRITQSQREYAQGKIGEAETLIQTQVTPKLTEWTNRSTTQNQLVLSLQKIKQDAINAKTINEITGPAQTYASLSATNDKHDQADIDAAKKTTQEIEQSLFGLRQQAVQLNRQCDQFPPTNRR